MSDPLIGQILTQINSHAVEIRDLGKAFHTYEGAQKIINKLVYVIFVALVLAGLAVFTGKDNGIVSQTQSQPQSHVQTQTQSQNSIDQPNIYLTVPQYQHLMQGQPEILRVLPHGDRQYNE